MTKSERHIGIRERPWAARRDFQRFLGVYFLDAHTGIYIDQDVSDRDRRLLSATFRRLPPAMQRRCRDYEVTFSTCVGCTAAGNSSTFYGDFTGRAESISPHIEMSKRSLAPDMVLPHMTHEAAHLWWRTLTQEERQAYSRFLLKTCTADTIEATDYVQEHFRNYQRALAEADTHGCADCHRRAYETLWVEESFCDTVAVLQAPDYPSRRKDTTVNLTERSTRIKDVAGLQLG